MRGGCPGPTVTRSSCANFAGIFIGGIILFLDRMRGVCYDRLMPTYTSDPPLFSGQARPRPHVLPAFTLRPENGPIIRLTVPAVNAGRQKTSAGTVSPPFRPAPDLTEAPLSDFAVSRNRRKTQLVRPIRLEPEVVVVRFAVSFIGPEHARVSPARRDAWRCPCGGCSEASTARPGDPADAGCRARPNPVRPA